MDYKITISMFYDLRFRGVSVGVSGGVGASVGASVGVAGDSDVCVGVSVVAFNCCVTFFILSSKLFTLMAVLFRRQFGVAFEAFCCGHCGLICGRTCGFRSVE